jgi:multidrug efflux pump subunit AcrA (membrane-fusion protein)
VSPQQRTRLDSLRRERFEDPAAGLEVGTAEETLKSLEEQLGEKRRDRRDLVLTAPRDGVVLPAPALPAPGDDGDRLRGWSGYALDETNLGALFTEGTVLCHVGDAGMFEAAMIVDQSDVEFVARGQQVELKLDSFAWKTFTGGVEELAVMHLAAGAERLSVKAGGQVPTQTDAAGREQPISTSYEALMHLDDPDGLLTPGMRGTARIRVGSRTVGQWLLRLLWQTFNFRM